MLSSSGSTMSTNNMDASTWEYWGVSSAEIAKIRLIWCVCTRRNGGNWEFTGKTMLAYRETRAGVLLVCKPRMRFVGIHHG